MSNRILTKNKFETWLRNRQPRTKIGMPAECDVCPIAKFLVHTTGIKYLVNSYGTCSSPMEPKKDLALPLWAVKFIDKVDECTTKYITAKKCLELLKAA